MDESANGFLGRAAELLKQRGSTYDKSGAERSMPRTITAFNAITGKELTESEGWLFLLLLKQARQWSAPSYHEDSANDGVAYAALLAESLARPTGAGLPDPEEPIHEPDGKPSYTGDTGIGRVRQAYAETTPEVTHVNGVAIDNLPPSEAFLVTEDRVHEMRAQERS